MPVAAVVEQITHREPAAQAALVAVEMGTALEGMVRLQQPIPAAVVVVVLIAKMAAQAAPASSS